MAGLHDSEVIDLVAARADGAALLVIVKEGPWIPTLDSSALRAKINTYAQFVLDGELYEHYPKLAERPVVIQVESREPVPEEMQQILALARKRLQPFNVSLADAINPNL